MNRCQSVESLDFRLLRRLYVPVKNFTYLKEVGFCSDRLTANVKGFFTQLEECAILFHIPQNLTLPQVSGRSYHSSKIQFCRKCKILNWHNRRWRTFGNPFVYRCDQSESIYRLEVKSVNYQLLLPYVLHFRLYHPATGDVPATWCSEDYSCPLS